MHKTISKLLISFCLVIAVQNTEASPAQVKSVKELIKLSELENILHTSLDEMQPTLDAEAENILLRILGKQRLTTTEEHLAVIELGQLLKETSSKCLLALRHCKPLNKFIQKHSVKKKYKPI